jgi:glycosyltransferase involved in cell wall biosynthesis
MTGERQPDAWAKPYTVLVATPLGRGGRGGIDRLMDGLREALGPDRTSDGRLGPWRVRFGTPWRVRFGTPWRVRFGTTRGQGSIWLSPFYLAAFLGRLIGRTALGRVDLVHINLSSDGSARRKAIVGKVAQRLGVPYVIHLHGSRFRTFFDDASPQVQASAQTLIGGASRVIVLGQVWRDFIAARVPAARDRIVILPNASDAMPDVAGASGPGPLRILFLGRVGARKGVPELVEALHALSDVDGWRAVIAGDGDVAETRQRIETLGLSSRVDVPGWVGPDEARALLRSSHILVLPSFDENLPMSVIEGMSAGLAIIATPVGAVEDIVRDGETGLLVPPGDAAALADALRRAVTDAALRTRLGASGRDFHRQNLDMADYVGRLAAIWSEAIR